MSFRLIREPLMVLEGNLRIVIANRVFYGVFPVAPSRAQRIA